MQCHSKEGLARIVPTKSCLDRTTTKVFRPVLAWHGSGLNGKPFHIFVENSNIVLFSQPSLFLLELMSIIWVYPPSPPILTCWQVWSSDIVAQTTGIRLPTYRVHQEDHLYRGRNSTFILRRIAKFLGIPYNEKCLLKVHLKSPKPGSYVL